MLILNLTRGDSELCVPLYLPATPADVGDAYAKLDQISEKEKLTRIAGVVSDSVFLEGVGQYEDFIRANWLHGRTADCVGLIKGYGWLDAGTLTIGYGTNGMPDCGANQMFHAATVKGTIDTIPEVPGLAVWREGHIGVYIGGGYIIEAMGTKYGVVKTKLSERGFTHWLEIPYINYD